jgi:hypothetical protein
MSANDDAMLNKIKSVVQNNIGSDHDLFATVNRLDIIGIRTVEITIGHNKIASVPEDVESNALWALSLVKPTIDKIVSMLQGEMGYSVADSDTYSFNGVGISFRMSLSPVFQKKEVEVVESKNTQKDSGTVTWA